MRYVGVDYLYFWFHIPIERHRKVGVPKLEIVVMQMYKYCCQINIKFKRDYHAYS